ncbi:hydrogenase nickel incorporation protein HypB [Citrobacter koseri]|uniref:Hydrogenase nickel incorporation protein HypB n=1 Tax=Citrobacter koseri TaxID=545 RepID=A0A2X2WMN4_CITKO|nr:hydrogenase nickel incorporation protein HypB [Citrobacter koseri]
MCTTCGCGEGNLYIEGDEHNPHSAFRSAPFAPAARPALNITGREDIRLYPEPDRRRRSALRSR